MKRYTVIFSNRDNVRVSMPDMVPEYDEWVDGPKRHVTKADALDRAIKKAYGKKAFWWEDNGARGYGQVCRPSLYGGNDCITPRIGIDVEEGW